VVVTIPPPRPDRPAQSGPLQRQECTRKLAAAELEKEEGCVVDEQVTAEPGILRYPCGDGAAEARFRQSIFRGEVRGGDLELRFEHEFQFVDGCRWHSVERIVGTLARLKLHYSYDDAPLPEQLGCWDICGATTEITVTDSE
jgi:hypothetical protein